MEQSPNLSGHPSKRNPRTMDYAQHLEAENFQQRLMDENQKPYRPDWVCMTCGDANRTRNEECRKCHAPAPKREDWTCGVCKGKRHGQDTMCFGCMNPSRIPAQDKASRQWQNLPRNKEDDSHRAHDLGSPKALAHERTMEREERMERWNANGGNKFVPFRPMSSELQPLSNRQSDDSETLRSFNPGTSRQGVPSLGRSFGSDEQVSAENLGVQAREDRFAQAGSQTTAYRRISFDPSFLDDAPVETLTPPPSKGGVVLQEREAPRRGRDSDVPVGSARRKLRKSGFKRKDEMMEFDEDDNISRKQERAEQRKKAKQVQKMNAAPAPVYLPEFISVLNLSGLLRIRVEDFLQKMKDLGFDDLKNDHVLDSETAGLIAAEFNFEPIVERQEDVDLIPRPPAEDKASLPARPPVVTIMGHVDHGKTTLLDYLRKSSVAASEHGGITQHIGAFSVPMPGGRLVTFLDTPGHEAFLSMRQRGATVTDIVILVVAADDSVKPQTIEAVNHAQKAKVPMIVAINKVDKEDSNIDLVKQDLVRYNVEIEDYGGDTQVVPVSGKTGQGVKELEDAAVALADILDMRAETDGAAEGWVLEATTKKAGRVATVLVRRGTLCPGDILVAGTSWARVRSLRNEAGVMVPSAGPGTPVEVDGWREQPSAGDEMLQAPNEEKAKAALEYRSRALERKQMATDMAAVNEARRLEQEKRDHLEKAAEAAAAGEEAVEEAEKTDATPSFQEVFLIVKADVSGSLEAVSDAISALGSSEVRPTILRSGVGPITEFDIDHAAVAKGHIINFNTIVEGGMRRLAEEKGVGIVDQSIIYRLVDDVKSLLGERLPDVVTQKVLGEAEIAQVFEINVKGRTMLPVAGCRIRNGVISRGARVRVMRDGEKAYDGSLSSHPPNLPPNLNYLPTALLLFLSRYGFEVGSACTDH